MTTVINNEDWTKERFLNGVFPGFFLAWSLSLLLLQQQLANLTKSPARVPPVPRKHEIPNIITPPPSERGSHQAFVAQDSIVDILLVLLSPPQWKHDPITSDPSAVKQLLFFKNHLTASNFLKAGGLLTSRSRNSFPILYYPTSQHMNSNRTRNARAWKFNQTFISKTNRWPAATFVPSQADCHCFQIASSLPSRPTAL